MSSLKRHILNKHKNIPRLRERTNCQFCTREIVHFDNLVRHEKTCYKNPDRVTQSLVVKKSDGQIKTDQPSTSSANVSVSKHPKSTDRVFATKANVMAIKQTKSKQCHLCHGNFSSVAAFELHKKKCLLNQITCDGCNQEFIAPKYLQAHKLRCKPMKLWCNYCNQKFKKCTWYSIRWSIHR